MIGYSNLVLSLSFLILSLFFLFYIVYQIKRNKLLLRYSLMWMLLGILLLFTAIFPEPIFRFGDLLGFNISANFIFSVAIFFILLVCLGQSRTISQQTMKLTRTIQKQALLEKRLEDLEKKDDSE